MYYIRINALQILVNDFGGEARSVARIKGHGATLPVRIPIVFPRLHIRYPYRISKPQKGYLLELWISKCLDLDILFG
jgi:hypothetical protein